MVDSTKRPARVVQISDSHLFASPEGKLLGLNTEFSLGKVIERVRAEQPVIDAVLATGDLSQDGSLEAYRRFHGHINTLKAPNYWLQGNHDLTGPMVDALGGGSHLSPCVVELGRWRIVMLNSAVEHQVPGDIQEDDLAFLDEQLKLSAGFHVMVCLHHHPVPMGCKWLDTQVVKNAASFWQIVDRYSHVRAVVWGHVHQESDSLRNGVRLFSVPSTCVQFAPRSDDFAIDDVAPGYRWFDLHENGHIDSAVSRVEGVSFSVDFSIKGY